MVWYTALGFQSAVDAAEVNETRPNRANRNDIM
jgi:hypothetical protein